MKTKVITEYNKITPGFVVQQFNGTSCIRQEFLAGDQVDFEDLNGEAISTPDNAAYQPFTMVQPVSGIVCPKCGSSNIGRDN